MTHVDIRPATEADLSSLQALIAQLFAAMDSPPDTESEDVVENGRTLIRNPSNHIHLATQHDEVVGFINFTTRRTLAHSQPSGLIDELVVAADHGGQGIGCEELEVSTEKNNFRARKFYKRSGFEEDTVLLEKHLDV